MGILYQVASKEVMRQTFIKDLLALGVTHHKGKEVYDLDYNEAKHVLTMERIKREE